MSGTQTYAGLPQAAIWRGSGRIARLAFLIVVAVAVLSAVPGLTFAAGAGAPAQCGADDHRTEWSAGSYVAGQDESLVALDFATVAPDLKYEAAVYGSMAHGSPGDLLGRAAGRTGDPGFYSIRFEPVVALGGGRHFFVVLKLRGDSRVKGFLDPESARADRQPFLTETAEKAFRTGDGEAFAAAEGTPVPFAVRVLAEVVHPEATSIVRFVADPMITAGSPMNFTFSATGTAEGDSMDYYLKFGDGSEDATGSGTSPIVDEVVTHTYDVAGTYTAVLSVFDTVDGTSAQATLVVRAAIPVTSVASPDCGLAALNVCFTSTATNGTPPYTYAWNFGDGQSSTEQNPCHVYRNAGTYNAILTVRDSRGAYGQAEPIEIRVSLPMIVSITSDITDGIPPTIVNFCANVSRGLTPYTYEWDFGDGTDTCPDQCPQHAFNEVGAYEVNLTVTDDCGQVVEAEPVTITVHESPWIRITSPVQGATVRGDVPLQVAIMVEAGVTIRRVDYYIDNYYLTSLTAPPWAATWISNGNHGTFTITAVVTDSLNRSTTSAPVSVNVDNPYLDGRVDSMNHPFRLRVYGLFFERGCVVKINGTQVPVTQRKGSNLVLAKGDTALKALVPEGVPVLITVWNPDGGISQESTFIRY